MRNINFFNYYSAMVNWVKGKFNPLKVQWHPMAERHFFKSVGQIPRRGWGRENVGN
jgi:hypothetical protein